MRTPETLSLTKLITSASYRHANYQVFSDFVEMAAISISNAVDIPQRDKREAEFMRIVKKYEPKEVAEFPKMLGCLVDTLETEFSDGGGSDVLGKTYHELELHNKWAGQYFTPFEICRMMAKMTVGDLTKPPECGFLTVGEPAAGSGAMVLAFAAEMKAAGINYQQNLHVTATDVDAKCVHMSYLQLSLLHIPAVIIHGNSLSLEEYGRWYTPAHILGNWGYKLRRKYADEAQSPANAGPEDVSLESLSLQDKPQPAQPDITFTDRGQGLLFGEDA